MKSAHFNGGANKKDVRLNVLGWAMAIFGAVLISLGLWRQFWSPAGFTAEYRDGDVHVTAVYGRDANIPAGAELRAYVVSPDTDGAYDRKLADALTAAGRDDAPGAMMVNVGFFLGDREVEPAAPVTVTVRPLKAGFAAGEAVTVVHLPEDADPEVLKASNLENGTTSFTTDSFSAFVILGGPKPIANEGTDRGKPVTEENGQIFYCGQKAHTHGSGCYDGENNLTCGKEEHDHMKKNCPQDLAPFFKTGKITDGSGNEVPSGGTIVVGEEYTFTVTFQEDGSDNKQFSNRMYYQLPAGFKCDTRNGEVRDPKTNDVIGHYTVDESGLLTVDWIPEFIEKYNDVKADFTFYTVAQDNSERQDVELPWTDTNTEQFNLERKGDATMKKTAGTYDSVTGTMHYTIEVTVTKGQVEGGSITDSLVSGLKLPENFDASKLTVTVTDSWGNKIGGGYTVEVTTDEAGAVTGWTLEDLPSPLTKDSKVVIEYDLPVDRPLDSQFKFDAENEATFTGTTPDQPHTSKEWGSNTKTHIEDKMLEKTGSQVAGKSQIDWEIKVGQSGAADVRGWILKDTLGEGQEIDTSKPFQVKWKKQPNDTVITFEVDWTDITVTKNDDGSKTFSYTIPEAGDPFWTNDDEIVWEDGDWVKLEYYTTYTPNGNGSAQTFNNKVETQVGDTPLESEKNVTVGKGAVVKSVSDNESLGYLEYTVSTAVPSRGSLNESSPEAVVYVEGPLGKDGTDKKVAAKNHDNWYPNFYYKDILRFNSVTERDNQGQSSPKVQYFVDNQPIIETIVATLSDGSEVEFVELSKATEPWNPDTNPGGQHTFKVHRPDPTVDEDGRAVFGEFQIWFDTQVIDKGYNGLGYDSTGEDHTSYRGTRDSSIWYLNEVSILKIVYQIPYTAKLLLEQPKESKNYIETDLTVGALLNRGETIKNEVEAKRKGEKIGKDEVTYNRPQKQYTVVKDGRLSEEGVIDYQVRFNGYGGIGENGKMIEVSIEDLVFEDLFDTSMEYVEDSLKVLVYRDLNLGSTPDEWNTFYYIGSNPVIRDGVIRVPANEFVRTTSDGKENLEKFLKDHGCVYVFCYSMRLKDEALNAENIVLHNEATVSYEGGKRSDTADVPVTNQLVKKTHKIHTTGKGETGVIDYTIELNPGGQMLGATSETTGETHTLDYICVEDEMSKNLSLDRPGGAIGVTVQYEAEDGTWMDLKRAFTVDEVKVGSGKFFFDQTEHGMRVYIPNGLHVKIEYTCVVLDAASVNVEVSNKVTTSGAISYAVTDDTKYEVKDSEATATGGGTVYFFKQDGDTDAQLGGAKFDLYTAAKAEENAGIATVTAGETKHELYFKKSVESNWEKGVELDKVSDPAAYYVLVETEAPTGYLLPDTPVVVYRIGEPEGDPETVTVNVGGKEYKDVKVEYITTTLVVENHQMAYSLPETGGPGVLPYVAAGLTLALCGLALLGRKSRARRS